MTFLFDIVAPLGAALAVVAIAGLTRASFPAAAVVALAAAATVTFWGDMWNGTKLLDQSRDAPAKLTEREARLNPALQNGINVAFFDWARGRMAPGDTFAFVHDEAATDPMPLAWSRYQMLPHRIVAPQQADWLVLYESAAATDYADRFDRPVRFAPGFQLAKARDAG